MTQYVCAWGANTAGQLGDGSMAAHFIPVMVDTAQVSSALYGKTVVAISAGQGHSLALDSQGLVYAWGNNSLFKINL